MQALVKPGGVPAAAGSRSNVWAGWGRAAPQQWAADPSPPQPPHHWERSRELRVPTCCPKHVHQDSTHPRHADASLSFHTDHFQTGTCLSQLHAATGSMLPKPNPSKTGPKSLSARCAPAGTGQPMPQSCCCCCRPQRCPAVPGSNPTQRNPNQSH